MLTFPRKGGRNLHFKVSLCCTAQDLAGQVALVLTVVEEDFTADDGVLVQSKV